MVRPPRRPPTTARAASCSAGSVLRRRRGQGALATSTPSSPRCCGGQRLGRSARSAPVAGPAGHHDHGGHDRAARPEPAPATSRTRPPRRTVHRGGPPVTGTLESAGAVTSCPAALRRPARASRHPVSCPAVEVGLRSAQTPQQSRAITNSHRLPPPRFSPPRARALPGPSRLTVRPARVWVRRAVSARPACRVLGSAPCSGLLAVRAPPARRAP